MANYTISITSESEYVGPPLYVIYSTYMSPSTPSGNLVVGDTLTISYTKNAGGQSYVTIESLDSSIWNTSANTQLNSGESLVLTATGTGTDQIIANFPSSNFQDHNRNVTVEAAAPPTIDSFLATPSVTTGAQTVTLSAAVSDADGTVDSISITQLSGTTVTLSSQTEAGIGTNSATASVTFTSPNENGTLEFQVSATDDSNGTGTSQITVVTNTSGGTVTPPTGDGYGLEVYGPDGTTPYLRITDRITSILAYLSGTLSNTNTSDTYTVPGVRNILWDGAASTNYNQTPRVSISGDVITITRAPGVTGTVTYYFIVCGD